MQVPTEPPSHMLAELDDTGKRICEILKEVIRHQKFPPGLNLIIYTEISGEALLDKTSSFQSNVCARCSGDS